MVKNHNIIVGLDIGTDSAKTIAALRMPDSQNLEVLGQVRKPMLGVRKGVVADIEEVSKRINQALSQLQEVVGQRIEEVYVNINGAHIFSAPSHGTVIVSRANQEISQEDIDRVIQSAQAFSLPSNKEILDIFPTEFIVDGEKEIKEPLGMQGVRLEADILALCAFSPYLKNLTAAVLDSDVQIADIIVSPLASARAILTPQQKELGVCLVDIGAGTVGMAVYQEGSLIHSAVLPVGSANITNDIAVGLKTDIDTAERIKKEFGTCVLRKDDKKEKTSSGSRSRSRSGSRSRLLPEKTIKIELTKDSSPLIFSPQILFGIIEPRISEIFSLIQKELKKIPSSCLLPGGVVFTGGGSKLAGIIEVAKEKLRLPCVIGLPQVSKGSETEPEDDDRKRRWLDLKEDPSLAAVCGLVLRGVEMERETKNFPFAKKGLAAKFKKIFKVFIP